MKIIGTYKELCDLTWAIQKNVPYFQPVWKDLFAEHDKGEYFGRLNGHNVVLQCVKEEGEKMTSQDFEIAAKRFLCEQIKKHYAEAYKPEDINMVWFAHVLGNKKAIFIDNGQNERLYEVTYNAAANEMYIDEYGKLHNSSVDAYCQ